MPLETKEPKEVAGALYRHVDLDLAGFPLILRSDNERFGVCSRCDA